MYNVGLLGLALCRRTVYYVLCQHYALSGNSVAEMTTLVQLFFVCCCRMLV
jgi:hypothetical protein